MPLRVFCPNGHMMMVPDERAGKNIGCPKCGCEVLVPGSKAGPPRGPEKALPTAAAPVPTAVMPRPKPPAIPKPPLPQPPGPPLLSKPPVERVPTPEVKPPPPPLPPPPVPPPPIPPPVVAATITSPPPAPPPVAPPPEPAPPPTMAVTPPDHVSGAYYLCALLAAVAILGAAPAVWEIFDYLQFPSGQAIAGWAFVLLLLAFVQIAYAVYVAHVPDWTSAWVVSIVCLSSAVLYAMLLGITFVSREESRLIQALQLTDKLVGNKAAFWSIAMISALSLLSWFAGHISSRWYRAEGLMRHTA